MIGYGRSRSPFYRKLYADLPGGIRIYPVCRRSPSHS
jgi:hypothetical protein